VYQLFKRVEGGLAAVKEMMALHVRGAGKELVTDPEKGKDPLEYIEVGGATLLLWAVSLSCLLGGHSL